MKIYNYDFKTGAFTGAGEPDPDPMSPGRWLIPAFASIKKPPKPGDREWPFWINGAWTMKPDFRNVPLYQTANGAPASINEPGVVPADVDLTDEPKPSDVHVWRDGAWGPDEQLVEHKARADATAEFATRMEKARAANYGKADAMIAGVLTDTEVAIFKAWAAYQVALSRVMGAPDFPKGIAWPNEPDEVAIAAEVEAEAKRREAEAAAQGEAQAAEGDAPAGAP
ncbi:tail fiber assembly protein [Burkholderia stagnalis]|uniref:tail fiber assembly protein n=1 Tax=Burkholderia stagnalis TaxID=1503054 RepID=UPI002AB56FDF|nr:tail fiber assembly protein [Burkholderia stagnalis]MDY7807764.1 tail fiber assembly protein [Burkholderia stagnalis]